ncbi:lipoma-preferred partner homolog isoform X1 [Tribolium castaneum]|uniref:Lipoma-preferred partner homolog-like Protein n=1 Tax=Tribolium castaneum TaxID=7070 RepID=D2A3T5_TRICA|nr:PREDICTED: lipoma-preferred partner homolog isoform X1 [Tribolium castaneum]EFA05566.2 Lipoma-preferred partner homolog-like Protein [Tribolium castaneum]|eukprot:XP_008194929.1 PREDICTED: lipoma-preferred partner homolog isoform X1 [Tribolium castaneum]
MNDLDKQLAELALINKAELPPNPKKIGPAVPPKPKKTQPQIPQSYPLKQPLEPSYSSRLQTSQLYSNLPPQNTYANLPRPQIKTTNLTPKPYTKPDHVTYSNIQVGQSRNADGLIYSNLVHPPREGNVYSNVSQGAYANGEDLPPPPPPLDLTANLGEYAPCTINTNLPPPPEDLLPPPSPVSSSYSELRRATQPGAQEFNYSLGSQYADSDSLYGYGAMSQSSSTYESIYEPINPRPPSQMSSRSNYSLYAPYVSGNSSTMTGPSQSASRMEVNKLQEVDSLTDLLVQGMDNEQDQDVYGVCVKCGEKIIGENSGCTAMDQLYHTKCFTCHHCAINLQGKPFYALDGKPYCEEDYLNTLEKCCVCQKPILDRILRATGKPYHPKCFCCVVCGKSLDGIPFTVDATNRVHCIEDFHKIFAPRCWVCKQPIMPEPGEEETVRVVALDHSFHIQCYKCEDCGLVLSSEAEGRGCYPLDDHVLCKSCNAKRVQTLTNHMTTEL